MSEIMRPLFEPPPCREPTEGGAEHRIDFYIAETVGALTDPLIVFPGGGWEETLPERLKNELPLHRLAHAMRCIKGEAQWDEATDLEALLYLYPASLTAPMSEHRSRIYLYLGTKCYAASFPEDIKQETLDSYEMGMLRDLKQWIRKKKVEARHRRQRDEKLKETGEPQPAEPTECEQLKLFSDLTGGHNELRQMW